MDEHEVSKPARLRVLENRLTDGGLTDAEMIEMENLQNRYAHSLAGAEDLEVDPVTGLRMEYNPVQISPGYQPVEPSPAVVELFRKRKGLPVAQEKPLRWWQRLARRINGR